MSLKELVNNNTVAAPQGALIKAGVAMNSIHIIFYTAGLIGRISGMDALRARTVCSNQPATGSESSRPVQSMGTKARAGGG